MYKYYKSNTFFVTFSLIFTIWTFFVCKCLYVSCIWGCLKCVFLIIYTIIVVTIQLLDLFLLIWKLEILL